MTPEPAAEATLTGPSPNGGPHPTRVFHRDLSRRPPIVSRAEGVTVWDESGREYLDASSGGNVVVSIGYGVPEIIAAMNEQASRVSFCGAFSSEAQERLAVELTDFAPDGLEYARFTSGGAEANETAIKLARYYFLERGMPRKSKIIGRWRSFHGNTLGALSATGHVLRRLPYSPLLAPFPHVAPPYRYRCGFCAARESCTLACADDLERAIINEGAEEVAAFICEPVVGAAAMGMLPPEGYLRRVREVCDRYDVLLITDEVLCGMGRTGRNFAVDHWDVVPDIITCGKGVSSGYSPLGAVLTTAEVYETVRSHSAAFEHGFTYGGNPLSCAVGLAVLRYLRQRDLVARSAEIGEYLIGSVREAIGSSPIVGEISGLGCLVGIELVADRDTREPFPYELRLGNRVAGLCQEQGVLINPSFSGNVDGIRGDRFGICPPYIFERRHVDRTVEALAHAITEVEGLAS